jgi:hypothetical protein
MKIVCSLDRTSIPIQQIFLLAEASVPAPPRPYHPTPLPTALYFRSINANLFKAAKDSISKIQPRNSNLARSVGSS